MGTRGFVGFVADEKETYVYNHFDSYPSGLGIDVLEFARTVNTWDVPDPWAVVKSQASRLKHIDETVPPTEEDIRALAPWTNLSVSERSTSDWYCLTRETQGNIGAILASGYASNDPHFPYDSLFCEWGYLLDLDRGVLEVYEGFQDKPHSAGRFAERAALSLEVANIAEARNGYGPVALVATFNLTDVPSDADMIALESEDE